MLRRVLRFALYGSLAVLMSPIYVPKLLHLVAFVTDRPVAVDGRATGYRVEEGAAPMAAMRSGSGRRVTIESDGRGHFQTDAAINGRSVPVLIDTGATSVALRQEDVSRLGLRQPMPSDYTVPIATANGQGGPRHPRRGPDRRREGAQGRGAGDARAGARHQSPRHELHAPPLQRRNGRRPPDLRRVTART